MSFMNNMSLSYCMSEAFNGAPKKKFLKKTSFTPEWTE